MSGRRLHRFLFVSALAGVALLGVSSATGAAPEPIPDGMSTLDYHRMMAQIPLDNAAQQIRDTVVRPGAGHDGFTEIWVDADHNTVTVYWHGTVPADIQQLFAALGKHMTVNIAAARYSKAQLDDAVNHVQANTAGLSLGEIVPMPDGSGLTVGVRGVMPNASTQQLFGTDVAITVSHETGANQSQTCQIDGSNSTLTPPARCDDVRPGYWGGAVIINGAKYCTTGFGMHSTVDSRTYMATAGHCGQVGDSFQNGQEQQTLGTMTHNNYWNSVRRDAGLIETDSGNAYYDGPGIFNGDTHNSKLVVGEQPSAIHDWVCVSGTKTGVICGIQIAYLNVTTGPDQNGRTQVNMAYAKHTNGGPTLGGDSGGPVFSLAPNNKVMAKGIHHGTDVDPVTGIGTEELFTTIDWVSTDFKVTVNTG
jgi:hypothetical protein